MTMQERITASVREKLASAMEGERKEEIIEELSDNLYAKYEDLVKNQGVDPEEAYGAAMDGLGDVSELIALCGGTRVRAEWNAAVDSLADMGRSMADSIKVFGGKLKNKLRDLEISVDVDENRHRFDYSIPAEGIAGLDMNVVSGDISIHLWDEADIQVIERSSRPLDENRHASFTLREDGILQIQQGSTAAGATIFGFGLGRSDFEVSLPRRLWQSLTLRSVSGDVILEDPLEAASLQITSVSGDIDLGEGTVCDALVLKTTSGDVESRCLTCRAVSFQTASGDIDLDLLALPEALEVKTASGDVDLTLPENDGFAIAYRMTSGDFDSQFELLTSMNRRSGTAAYKSAQAPLYAITTTSGDIDLRRR